MQQINLDKYNHQLNLKIKNLKKNFSHIPLPILEIYKSEAIHFRMRSEFRIWHKNDQVFYAMNNPDKKIPYIITEFLVGSKKINELMPLLLIEINKHDELKNKLFSAKFLTTLSGDTAVTLIYHKPIDENWRKAASDLHLKFNINIIGRSRKKKLTIGYDYVVEKLLVDGVNYYYKQIENGFTQPNAKINQAMLSWSYHQTQKCGDDLLELYCGNGNFTCVLSQNFEKILATEISKDSVDAAYFNLKKNNIENVSICRMSSEEITLALNGVRKFRRLKNIDLDNYKLNTIFVDPPRAGLDEKTLNLLKKFKNILYISCNPLSLLENIQGISNTHVIENFAVFDQFPYTDHLECGVFLQKKL